MKTVEKEVNKFNFPQILLDLHRESRTGILTVDTSDVIKKVYLDKGKAVFASSTDEDDRLGEMLIKLGKITIEQYEKSVELLKQTGKRQGTILVELGYLTPKDLVLGVKAQVREIIYSLFQEEYAEYEFREGPLPTREVITLQMSMGNLIYEGMKRINNVVRIKRDMPDMDAVLRLNDDPASLFQDIVLTPRDKAMIEMIDGTKTIKELIDSTPTATFEALKTLYILYVSGFVGDQTTPERSEGSESEPGGMTESESNGKDAFEKRVNEFFSNVYKMNPHEILGIDETTDAATLQKSYYDLIKEYHPDEHISSRDPLMLDKLMTISEEIQKAFVLLRDDEARRNYFRSKPHAMQKAMDQESAEEHFRSELAKVNEEIFPPSFATRKQDGQEDQDIDSERDMSDRAPDACVDFPPEENSEEFFPSLDSMMPASTTTSGSSVAAFLEEEADVEIAGAGEQPVPGKTVDWSSWDATAASQETVDREEAEESSAAPLQETDRSERATHEEEDAIFEAGIPASDIIAEPDILGGELSAEKPMEADGSGVDRPTNSSETDVRGDNASSYHVAINQQLLNLIGDIKALLTDIRSELPKISASNQPIMDSSRICREVEETPAESGFELSAVQEGNADDLQTGWQEEFITVPETVQKYMSEQEQEIPKEERRAENGKEVSAKRRLHLWYIAVPSLFLIAAVATFLFLYSPEQQITVSQPVQQQSQNKMEVVSPAKPANVISETPSTVQKADATSILSAPEVKTVPAAAPHTLQLVALDSTWLSAAIDGKEPKEMILRPGEKLQWTAQNSILLTIGNAAGLKLVFDGKELGPLGKKGKVVKMKLPAAGDR